MLRRERDKGGDVMRREVQTVVIEKDNRDGREGEEKRRKRKYIRNE